MKSELEFLEYLTLKKVEEIGEDLEKKMKSTILTDWDRMEIKNKLNKVKNNPDLPTYHNYNQLKTTLNKIYDMLEHS